MTQRRRASLALLSLAGALAAIAPAILAAGCDPAADRPADGGPPIAPLTAELRLVTTGAAPVFIYLGCVPELTITQVSPPRRDVTPTGGCACACEDAACQGNLACGACYAQALEIDSASPFTYNWQAVTQTSEPRGGWSCIRTTNLPPGDYLIRVAAYASAQEAEAHTGARNVDAIFSLPASAPITVDLTAP